MTDIFSKIKALQQSGKLTEYETGKLSLFGGSLQKTVGAYKDDPTAANRRNMEAAERGLAELVADLAARHMPTPGRVYKNRLEALEELHRRGFNIQKSKLYADVRAGLLKISADKTITDAAIDQYIHHPESGLTRHMETVGAGVDVDLKELVRRKAEAQLEKETVLTRKYAFELEKEKKQWMPRADFTREMAGRAAALDHGLEMFFRMQYQGWVRFVGGNMALAQDLLEQMITAKNKMLTEYMNETEFHVMFEDEG